MKQQAAGATGGDGCAGCRWDGRAELSADCDNAG